jgi:hypothetical protein
MTLVVKDIEATDLERSVSVWLEDGGFVGKETLFSERWLGTCKCGRPASALVWRIQNRFAPIKEQRNPRIAGVAATAFQTEVDVPSAGRALVTCQDCAATVDLQPVDGKVKADHVCDVRCTSARGRKCECSCGGHNHGADWHV